MTYAVMISGVIGMLGFFFAWLAQRAVVRKGEELAAAVAGEQAAKALALESEGKAATAQAQLSAATSRADSLQTQLDAERKARQDLVHGLAKNGLPVGEAVVDSALDRLYPNGDGDKGSSGSGSNTGGNP